MSQISPAYNPQEVESRWYKYWLERDAFKADPASKKAAYSIVIPPPNVTGVLTLGHVLNNTIQDILARRARMTGKEVLWLPGTDHAGIATQTVVEKALKKQGVCRHRDDLGREAFLEKVWEWKHKHGGIIIEQLKRLGASCDWSRERFTMDPGYSRCVQRVFVDLYRKGFIYRGKRMVNWDPVALTALSDEEVIMTEERGSLWHIRYPLLEADGDKLTDQCVVVATTRPETMLGDEAVAVHSQDPRYARLVGRKVLLPLRNKRIPIIADEAVDPKFGTGCVKVTPSHDPADYEIALRHRLPMPVVIGPDGTMTSEAGEDFVGLDRLEARNAAVERLEEQGLLVKTEPYVHSVGYSERSHVPIEPRLSEQWFLRYPSVERSIEGVERGDIRFWPERWTKTYTHWMRNLKDWCISRQLWWGHRIPVWHKRVHLTEKNWAAELLEWGWDSYVEGKWDEPAAGGSNSEILVRIVRVSDGKQIDPSQDPLMPVVAATEGAYDIFVCTDDEERGRGFETHGFKHDPDVLDTWFSSWLWPFATMGWPERTPALAKFYPTADLVTGPDIIFFWVARMIMAGYQYMGQMPFANVYYTGIIRDKLGRKMSKSLGNSPDPLDLIDTYGADALRFGVMRSAPLGQDVLYDEQHVELGRNFCNKLWNACRFRQLQGGEAGGEIAPALLTSDDKWILLRLDCAIREVDAAFAEYRFSEVTQTLYRFFWSEYCDWYIEASKAVLQAKAQAQSANTLAVIDFVLSHTLRLFHPFLPFVTEELWAGLGYNRGLPNDQGGETMMSAQWPKPLGEAFRERYGLTDESARLAEAKYELASLGRNLRREKGIASGKRVKFILRPAAEISPQDALVLKILLNAEPLVVDRTCELPKGTPTVHASLGDLYLPIEGLMDIEAEKARLEKELAKAQGEIAKVRRNLDNPAFVEKVPPAVLEQHRKRLAEWEGKLQKAKSALNSLMAA